MKQASLFFRNVSVVDHGFIDEEGRIIGGSYYPNVTVTGKVTEDENVVIDFSKGKDLIKKAFDDIMDHKLWIIEGSSKVLSVEEDSNNDNVTILTPAVEYSVPKNRVFTLKTTDTFSKLIQDYLLEHGLDVTVSVEMTENTFSTQDNNTFRYSHGLKNSSSYGCKNMGHGHLSFIELKGGDEFNRVKLQNKMLEQLNNTVFIFDENIIKEDDYHITIGYTVGSETFEATYNKSKNKIIVSNEETTAENLVNLIANMYRDDIETNGITKLYLSEGLQKGTVVIFY